MTRDELVVLVNRLWKGDFDDDELDAAERLFVANVPHPDAENLLVERHLSVEQIVDYGLAGERFDVQGMAIPVVREPDGTRWIRFSDPRRTALHWAMGFRSIVERHTEFHDQGFSVSRTSERLEEGRRRWVEWTGTDLGSDIYELHPAWGGEGYFEPVVVPRAFLLALYEVVDRDALRLPGGAFGSSSPG